MISKGNTHNGGAKLADYMGNGKEGERAEVWDLRGFGATNIKDAFRDVQIMAGATKCSQPFFHVQVRNRGHEVLTREQFEYAADRIEKMLGLTGQPRAIAFHTYEENGQEHMHVAWSRIDEEKLTAKPLPYFKTRLKKISRELELHFALEPVTNQREGNIKYAPTKAQEEQARRLGIDIHEVRNAIRNCWDRSDCGTSFQAALDHEGLTLAQGERRDFVVIDRAGGIHALGKRILDMTAAKIRDRLSDIERDELPTIATVRTSLLEAVREQVKELERIEPHWDRDLADRAWQDAVIRAAIEKEKAERQFVEPKEREARAGERQAEAGNREKELGRTAGEIRMAYSLTKTGQEFANALEDRGFILARMSEADAERLNRWERQRQKEKEAANAISIEEEKKNARSGHERKAERYREGELVVLDSFGGIYQLTYANTGDRLKARNEHLADIDRAPLMSVANAEAVMKEVQQERRQEHREQREEAWQARINERNEPAVPPAHRVEELKGPAAEVWRAWCQSQNDAAFSAALNEELVPLRAPVQETLAAALDARGLSFAMATQDEASRSHRESQFAREIGRYKPKFSEGEIVIITEPGPERRPDGKKIEPKRVHRVDQSLAEKFVNDLGLRGELKSIDSALEASSVRAQKRSIERAAARLEKATDIKDFSRIIRKSGKEAKRLNKTGLGIGKGINSVADAILSLFAVPLTPEQKRDGERATHRRGAEAENAMDLSRYTEELAQQRQSRENEQEAERRQHRERDGGGRER